MIEERIDSGKRQRRVMSPWLFNLCINGVMKEVKIRMGKGSKIFRGREIIKIPWHLVYG